MTNPPLPLGAPAGFITIHRGELVAVAIVGVVLGLIALLWPDATLLTVAVLFGTYLVVSGLFRITLAFVAPFASTGLRWLSGVLGVLTAAAGLYCLINPGRSLVVLAFIIGFGWIAEGLIDIVAGLQGVTVPLWVALLSGIVSVVAGIIALTLPGLTVTTFLVIGAIMLIAVSLTTLLTLPRRSTIASR